MNCLVSGATGFIGRELCHQLAARQLPFTALSRRGGPLADGTATVAVDFCCHDVDAGLLQGVDLVFHLAGIAHQQAEDSAYEKINYQATLALAKASEKAGVKCFVYLSSVKAMGPPAGSAVRSEEQLCAPENAYGLSKWRAEQDLRSAFAASSMSVIILRPALVYGAGVKGNLATLAGAVRRGLPRPPEIGGRSMIAVQDLAGLMVQIACEPPCGVHTWIVCDGQRYSARRIYGLMRKALGKGPGVSYLPVWLWRVGAYLADIRRGPGEGSTFDKIFGVELYSSAALVRELPWQPEFELADIVAEIMAAPVEKSQ
ncbi:MAG: NAD-dependent epimerase/dehydratase family protein [Proteobacteria bacterium]|nr:NAD-dependent epimerase/dehydratase family protein [Pseudomonadota bacterium]